MVSTVKLAVRSPVLWVRRVGQLLPGENAVALMMMVEMAVEEAPTADAPVGRRPRWQTPPLADAPVG